MSLLGIVIRNVCVAGQAIINLDILWDSREWLIGLLPLQDWVWGQWWVELVRLGGSNGLSDLDDLWLSIRIFGGCSDGFGDCANFIIGIAGRGFRR